MSMSGRKILAAKANRQKFYDRGGKVRDDGELADLIRIMVPGCVVKIFSDKESVRVRGTYSNYVISKEIIEKQHPGKQISYAGPTMNL
jgi:hypothetical protein